MPIKHNRQWHTLPSIAYIIEPRPVTMKNIVSLFEVRSHLLCLNTYSPLPCISTGFFSSINQCLQTDLRNDLRFFFITSNLSFSLNTMFACSRCFHWMQSCKEFFYVMGYKNEKRKRIRNKKEEIKNSLCHVEDTSLLIWKVPDER